MVIFIGICYNHGDRPGAGKVSQPGKPKGTVEYQKAAGDVLIVTTRVGGFRQLIL